METANRPYLLLPESSNASPLTHAIPISQSGFSHAFIDIKGDLILVDGNFGKLNQIVIDALPDVRILGDGQGKLLKLTDPTENYDHGVLGDAVKADSFTRLDELQLY